MRFRRADLPGLALATLAPPLMVILFLASFEAWDHQGTPLLGGVASNVALPAAIIGAFSRFVKSWDLIVVLLGVILACVIGVNWAQRTGNDDELISTLLKLTGVATFMLLNAAFGYQILKNAILPILDRRDARTAAARDAAHT
jgi:NAD/NADP transhydrogenase beta subunit